MALFCGIIEKLDISGSKTGSLSGLTFVAKDLLDIKGYVTGAGNPDFKRTHTKAQKNCPAVQILLDEGARLIGKTVSDELAFSLDGTNIHFEIPYNPNMPDRIPGGSSSGSASAVANGVCDFALGTDTAGSVRVPSAFCGIFGMRPTYGRISKEGVVPLGTTFDTIGWMAPSFQKLRQVGSVLLKTKIEKSESSTKIILLDDCLDILEKPLHKPFLEEWEKLSALGFKQERSSLPANKLKQYSELFFVARGYEAWMAHGEWFEKTKPNMAKSIQERLLFCKTISKKDYQSAMSKREELMEEIDTLLENNFFFIPTVCDLPLPLSASEAEFTEVRKKNILLNSISSFCGLPQITVPFKVQGQGAKFAFSLVARKNGDSELLSLPIDFYSRLG